MRCAAITRTTKETDITAEINLDGCGIGSVKTGVGFFDHMIDAFAKHSGFDIKLTVKGDLFVDCHHTIEDAGICLGKAFAEAIGDKKGIARYGSFYVPMDEALAFCSVDVCGRPYLVFNGQFKEQTIGGMDTPMVSEFFRAFAFNAQITAHINIVYGENGHHKAEAAFKAFAHALSAAVKLNGDGVLSTKGVL